MLKRPNWRMLLHHSGQANLNCLRERGAMSDAIATWIIAGAGVANVFVYVKLWQESKKQNAATAESLRLARDAFVESHKPALAVSVINCKYFGDQAQVFDGELS
jgi:hypothetical protein